MRRRPQRPLPLIGIPIGDFRGDVIGNDEVVGVAVKEIHPVDAEEIQQDRRIRYDDRGLTVH